MLRASILSSPDFPDYTWSEEELLGLNVHLVGLPPWTTAAPRQQSRALNTREGQRTSSAQPSHDPLAALSARELFIECIWGSPESSVTKIMLLCIARFFDDDARSSSMSFAQVARECTIHEGTAKKIAVHVRGRWLEIEPKKGYYVPGKGAQNLYHGICPPELIEALRDRLRGVAQEYPEATQGKRGHPAMPRNLVSRSPRILSGSPRTTRTSLFPNEETASAFGDRLPSPHVGANGDFIISEEYRLAIPAATVMQWRARFPQIADLDAAMTGLGTKILAKGSIHPGFTCPEGWMVKILSEMNQEAADRKQVTAARIARAKSAGTQQQPFRGKSRRAELDEA